MNPYETYDIGKLINNNPYVGRGIIAGVDESAKNAVSAYFIMGRSQNSRNRVFIKEYEDVIIKPFDYTLVSDPSLIIYSPLRKYEGDIILTNGNQTDTIYDYLSSGKTFEQALESRCFEPDEPNFTPRISALFSFTPSYNYKLSILKSCDEAGSGCNRFTFSYFPMKGIGHFIHTYVTDGSPIPSFCGEPERVAIPSCIDEFTDNIWNNLNDDNKISLYVRYTDLVSGQYEDRLINKNKA